MNTDIKWYFIMIMVAAIAAGIAIAVYFYVDGQVAQSCIEAGKDWVQIQGTQYECVTP